MSCNNNNNDNIVLLMWMVVCTPGKVILHISFNWIEVKIYLLILHLCMRVDERAVQHYFR